MYQSKVILASLAFVVFLVFNDLALVRAKEHSKNNALARGVGNARGAGNASAGGPPGRGSNANSRSNSNSRSNAKSESSATNNVVIYNVPSDRKSDGLGGAVDSAVDPVQAVLSPIERLTGGLFRG